MWCCKECGKEVIAFMDIDEAYARGKINEYQNIEEAELIEWQDWTEHYECTGCGKIEDYDLEEIAYWDGEE